LQVDKRAIVPAVNHFEILLFKTAHEPAATIAHDGAHLDEIDG
jgi:hypothetical protein